MGLLPVAQRVRRPWALVVLALALVLALGTAPIQASEHAQPTSGVTKIVVDEKVSPAFDGQEFGAAGQYETLAGRAYGELDPDDPRNAIITDLELAPRNAAGMVEYMSTFFLVKPVDLSRSSGLLWHDVPNRGGRITLSEDARANGDIGLSSGWQGDDSGGTAHGSPGREYAVVPIARNPDGSRITGQVLGRITNAEGLASRPMIVHSNPVPYEPVTLDTSQATLTIIESETIEGVIGPTREVPSRDWAWARCSEEQPFPGTPDPTQVCVRGGYEPERIYQVVFEAQDPPVLGVGFAAFRDVASFLKFDASDADGTPNPVAGEVSWIIARGVSQSGNFLRAFLQLGFNEDTAGRQVQDGNWPIIAGRRVSLNTRFAMPDGVLKLYEPGSEGPQWWESWPDPVRDLPTAGILDRCRATQTCPKIIEHFGAAEIWNLKLGPEWVGTDAREDIPLPENVRRYYIPSTRHGGGSGSFDVTPPDPPACPGPGQGQGLLPDNPVPHVETRAALEHHFRNWVMQGVDPPPSQWPRLRDGNLVEPTKEAMGFPTIPGVPEWAPSGLINPVLDYDFGPDFDYTDASGVVTVVPPVVKQVIPALVPRVDADGNEVGGVPVVLRDAPLGTYLGWNITADGVHEGKICSFAGGMVPFAQTKAERLATGDPRLSLEERYGDHAGYVAAVQRAAANAVEAGFLLPEDASDLIARAAASDVLVGLFPDVPPGSVHESAITRLASDGVLLGFPDGTFGPALPTSRAQMASVLQRALGLEPVPTGPFRDVPAGSVHSGAINALAAAGIVQGRGDGTFGGASRVSRGQLATMLKNAGDLRPTGTVPFSDVAGDTHASAIDAAYAAGVVEGFSDGTFRPGGDVNRAQTASMVVRLLDVMQAEQG